MLSPQFKLTEMCCSFSKRMRNHELDSQNTPNKNGPWSIIICMSFLNSTFHTFNFFVILTYFKIAARNCQPFLFQWYRLNFSREFFKTVLKYINIERTIFKWYHTEKFSTKFLPPPPSPKPNIFENSNIYVSMYLK